MSDDLKDLVTKNDMPMMTKKEMEKTHANQHMQSKTITSKKTSPKKEKITCICCAN